MSERITATTLDARVENLNRRLELSGRFVMWNQRNGSVGLDEYRVCDDACIRTLTVGTKREVADFLHAMMVGIDMSNVRPDA